MTGRQDRRITSFASGRAWYMPHGKTTGEYPVAHVEVVVAVPNDRGYQYVDGTLYVIDGVDWLSLLKIDAAKELRS